MAVIGAGAGAADGGGAGVGMRARGVAVGCALAAVVGTSGGAFLNVEVSPDEDRIASLPRASTDVVRECLPAWEPTGCCCGVGKGTGGVCGRDNVCGEVDSTWRGVPSTLEAGDDIDGMASVDEVDGTSVDEVDVRVVEGVLYGSAVGMVSRKVPVASFGKAGPALGGVLPDCVSGTEVDVRNGTSTPSESELTRNVDGGGEVTVTEAEEETGPVVLTGLTMVVVMTGACLPRAASKSIVRILRTFGFFFDAASPAMSEVSREVVRVFVALPDPARLCRSSAPELVRMLLVSGKLPLSTGILGAICECVISAPAPAPPACSTILLPPCVKGTLKGVGEGGRMVRRRSMSAARCSSSSDCFCCCMRSCS